MAEPTNKLIQILTRDQYTKERADAVGGVIGYDKNVVLPFAELFPDGKPIRYCLTYDKELETMRPDWDKVAALGREWEREVRTKKLEQLVRKYQAGDESVLSGIEESLEALAYSAAKKFAFEAKTDTAVFLNEAGKFDKYIPKAPDTGDPEDEKDQVGKLYVQFVPFTFSDEDIEEQFPKSVKSALETYNPEHRTPKGKKTLFSTWFFRRFQLDLKSLYKNYKGEAEKIKNPEQYKQKGLTWSGTHVSIPDKTNIFAGDFTTKEADWMSLVLESYPYELSVNLRCELLNIKDRKTDKNRRDSIAKKLGRWRMQTENRSIDTYLLPKSNGVLYLSRQARTRPPAEFTLYQGDKWVGDIVLDDRLLTVDGYADPTPAAAFRSMDKKTELPTGMELIPAPAYNWYKDKDGLRLLPGVTGKYNASTYIKTFNITYEPNVRRFFVYHHVVRPVSLEAIRETPFPFMQKVYCKNLLTRSSLLGYLAIRDAAVGAGYIKASEAYKLSKFSSLFRIT